MKCKQCECDLRKTIPASMEEAEQLFLEFRGRCRCLLERSDSFVIELLLREAVTNAIVHGSGGNPALYVQCVMRMRPGRFVLVVSDEGKGFDWRKAWAWKAADTDCSGRGMEILRKYATRVRFSSKGNAATIWKRF